MELHTFGDSHSWKGWCDIKGVKINHLGPILCYSFGEGGLSRLDIREFNVKNGDIVVFCFGEIDCRCHIHKHIVHDEYKEVIGDMVDKYFKSIFQNANFYNKLNVWVYNVVPPLKDDHPVVVKSRATNGDEFPFVGDEKSRKKYVLYFNELLKNKCEEYGYLFVDVYDEYSTTEKFMNIELSDNNVHIKNPIHIQKFLQRGAGRWFSLNHSLYESQLSNLLCNNYERNRIKYISQK